MPQVFQLGTAHPSTTYSTTIAWNVPNRSSSLLKTTLLAPNEPSSPYTNRAEPPETHSKTSSASLTSLFSLVLSITSSESILLQIRGLGILPIKSNMR